MIVKLRLCSIVGALLSFTGFGAASEPREVPLIICVKKQVRERPEFASPETIKVLQQKGQLPANLAEMKRVILHSDYRIWGALSVKEGAPQHNVDHSPAGGILYPNYIVPKKATSSARTGRRGLSLPVTDILQIQNGSVDVCDGVVQGYGQKTYVSLVFRAQIDRSVHQILSRSLKQHAPWYGYPKVFDEMRAQASAEGLKLSSSIRLGNDQYSANIPYISLAYFCINLARWAKNLGSNEQPVLPSVCDSELIIPTWSDLRSLEKSF